ncbi:16S rRNA (guanine(527)-N(7))-methyltransferase RsmG [Parenemella sanctibonifatiensis]|uniref:Ribosomal RNA small subunit methyltransferase G n=1 Tax=Parenemella sanctibonifatiensis TaxID=2016505 RepID=A0A255EH45_9ACTN|nr:16S rRNA (guanine(527)-N(7))-methyltransferase RsmG [Parenemella sanctibonifatiensis]OYN90291.1 16S rRNA (guanine(527)-N(7))-methyltransferase RsmG [Parenemella sanctibonifatiensis]
MSEPVQPAGLGESEARSRVLATAGEHAELLEAYASVLVDRGIEWGLIGPREGGRIWERHLLNCAGLAELVSPDARVGDVGSGAGLPGLVLAIQRPDVTVVLIESLLRRTTFLQGVVDELGLANVEVVRSRAEDLPADQAGFHVVTCRAVAGLDKLLTWCLPLLSPTGELLALKGERARGELAVCASWLRQEGWAGDVVPALVAGEDVTSIVRIRSAR